MNICIRDACLPVVTGWVSLLHVVHTVFRLLGGLLCSRFKRCMQHSSAVLVVDSSLLTTVWTLRDWFERVIHSNRIVGGVRLFLGGTGAGPRGAAQCWAMQIMDSRPDGIDLTAQQQGGAAADAHLFGAAEAADDQNFGTTADVCW